MLTFIEIPTRLVLRQSYGRGDLDQVIGRRTGVRIPSGQPIQASDLEAESRGGFSTVIPTKDGDGAYTVSISKGIKPGLIQPSDHVDIFASFALPKTADHASSTATWRQGSDMVSVVLLQNVTVLAVGDAFGSGARVDSGGSADLTLAVTLQEAQLLMFATQHGELGALLRRDGSTEVKARSELPKMTFQDIERIIGDLDDRRNIRIVEVQKGGVVIPYSVSVTNAVKAEITRKGTRP
jgi:Flp pilus assembly protein CpaB